MKNTRFVLTITAITAALLLPGLSASAQTTKYGVAVKIAKTDALAKAKTYAWIQSQPSPIKSVDAQVVAAVNRELQARGFTLADVAAADVVATYGAIRRTDVDLKAKSSDGNRPEYAVGTLVVELRDRPSRKPVFRVRIDKPISLEGDQAEATINGAVAAMFEKYPARTAKP